MARRGFAINGAQTHDSENFVQNSAATIVAASLASTAGTSSYSPPSGALKWLKITGVSSSTQKRRVFQNVDGDYPGGTSEVALCYVPCRAILLDIAIGSGETGLIFSWQTREADGSNAGEAYLNWKYSNTNKFNFEFASHVSATPTWVSRTSLAVGSTEFDAQERITLLVLIDGTNLTLWAYQMSADADVVSSGGEAKELETAYTKLIYQSFFYCNAQGDVFSAEHIFYDLCTQVEADSTADRPNSDLIVTRMDADGEGSSQGYGDEGAPPHCGSTDALYPDVTLDGSDQLNTAVHWCELGGQGDSQGATLSTLTLDTGTRKLLCLVGRQAVATNTTSKTVATNMILLDASNSDSRANTNIGVSGDWFGRVHCFALDPTGNEWEDLSQSGLNAIEIEQQSDSGNGANDCCAGYFVDGWEVSTWTTPPAPLQAIVF